MTGGGRRPPRLRTSRWGGVVFFESPTLVTPGIHLPAISIACYEHLGYGGVMNTQELARATFVLSKKVNSDLAYLSRRMGRSRSALVREVLEPGITEMAALLRSVPDQPTSDQVDMFADSAVAAVEEIAFQLRRELRRG